MKIIESFNIENTYNIGLQMGQLAKEGDIFCLNGDLGVGKTVFSKGFAKGLNINDEITSPTFTILNVYNSGTLPLYHFDVYRIENIEDMYNIGYEEYFYGSGVSLIEWSTNIIELIDYATVVTIEKDLNKGLDYRKITIERMSYE